MTKANLLILLWGLGAFSPHLQAQVIESQRGKVEFIGLQNWTPEMIATKLGYDSPDKMHNCVALLKDKLGFAEASVIHHMSSGSDPKEKPKLYTVITVVEPNNAGQVQYAPKPTKSITAPAVWDKFSQAIKQQDLSNVMYELQFYAGTFPNAVKVDVQSASLPKPASWWDLLKPLHNKSDFETARKILSQDEDPKKRQVAALILTNFGNRDEAWSALMEGIRDNDKDVRDICSSALFTLTKYVPRTVNWAAAAESIRHLLNGTNLPNLLQVLRTLSKTNVSPKLADPLLKNGGGRMLLPYLRAKHEAERTLSHDVLTKLSGKDFGYDDARWAAWLAGIK